MPSSWGLELVIQLGGWAAHHLSLAVLVVLGRCWVACLSLVASLAGLPGLVDLAGLTDLVGFAGLVDLAGLTDLAGFAGFADFTGLAGSLLGLHWV